MLAIHFIPGDACVHRNSVNLDCSAVAVTEEPGIVVNRSYKLLASPWVQLRCPADGFL